jgi:hypothetical protein
MPVLVGDVRRVASSVAVVEPIASRHSSPLTALRGPYRFQGTFPDAGPGEGSLSNYRENVGAPDLESAVSVSAGWSVFARRDGAVYNTYRVYPHSRLVTPLFSVLLGLLPNKE